MVSGSGQAAPYAIVILAEDLRGNSNDITVIGRVENEMAQLLEKVNAASASYEKLQMVVISQEAWSIENGFLTPTMKIKRAKIEDTYNGFNDSWYEEKKPVIWQEA